ncbi:MAG: DUF5334 family protein [Deltaproteobacteria bacterium]|nr:DUF5334 family protein [Deltaproteobacteria bacterium]
MIRIVIMFALLFAAPVLAWDGFDHERGISIEIGKGNLVRPGQEIEYFDYDKGEFRYGEVESIKRYGSSVEVEVYDYDQGENRTFEMD